MKLTLVTALMQSIILKRVVCTTLLFLFAILCSSRTQAQGMPTDYFFSRTYSGKIDGKYDFTMELKKAGGIVFGSYRYAGKKQSLDLRGIINSDGSFDLKESIRSKETGQFKGKVVGAIIEGVWSTPKNERRMQFVADQVSGNDMTSVKNIMSRAAGVYHLNDIHGNQGANGMYGTVKGNDGKWWSSESYLNMGMREADTIKLTTADQSRLNSMYVSVDPGPVVRFMVGGKAVINIKIGSDVKIAESAIVLLSKEGVNFSKSLGGNYTLYASGDISISFNPLEDYFSITFDRSAESESMTFSKRPSR